MPSYRYIELNPIRAGVVQGPSGYPWSSYRTNALGETSDIIAPHGLYTGLGREAETRQQAYRDLLKSQLDSRVIDDIRESTNGNFALGNDRFKEDIEQMLQRRARPGRPGRPIKAEDHENVNFT